MDRERGRAAGRAGLTGRSGKGESASTTRKIVLVGETVDYRLFRARRQTIGMSVDLDGLTVRAPRWVTIREIEEALTERGAVVNGRGDTPNMHDILTGSQADGRAFPPGRDMTCGNWTLGGEDGAAMLGHHDRTGTGDPATVNSWNAAHPSAGCSMPRLQGTGGAGLLYCFAVN